MARPRGTKLSESSLNPHEDLSTHSFRSTGGGRRVALLFGSFRGGGIGRSMLRAAEELLARGFEVDLVVGRKSGDLMGEVPKNARVIELEQASKWRMRMYAMKAQPERLAVILRPVLLGGTISGKLR